MKRALVALAACAVAGCPRSSGEPKPQEHVAGARAGASSPAWTVPAWYVDGANSTGCASDANTCQSGTCAAGNVGPCSTYGEVIARWGTPSPTIAQSTRVTFLSDDGEPPFDVTPVVGFGGKFVLTGTLTTAASGTVGTVTAKNRATGQLLVAALGQAATGFVGLLFNDTTRSSYAWVDSATTGSSATLSQPMSLGTDCTTSMNELDTVQAGDAYQILRPPKVPLRSFNPVLRLANPVSQGTTCLEHVWVPDPSGTAGTSSFDYNISSTVDEARVDPGAFVRITTGWQEPAYGFNNFWNGGINAPMTTQNATGVIGGDVLSSENVNIANNGSFIFDEDVILHGFVLYANISGAIATAYVKSEIEVVYSQVQLGANITGPVLWGPGTLKIGPHASLLLEGTTATASLLQAGGTSFGLVSTITTGCALDTGSDPAPMHCGRALTNAHIDGTVASGGFGGSALDPFMASSITVER